MFCALAKWVHEWLIYPCWPVTEKEGIIRPHPHGVIMGMLLCGTKQLITFFPRSVLCGLLSKPGLLIIIRLKEKRSRTERSNVPLAWREAVHVPGEKNNPIECFGLRNHAARCDVIGGSFDNYKTLIHDVNVPFTSQVTLNKQICRR